VKKWRYLLAFLIALEILSAILYLNNASQLGFPLDDAWIHQTYARNLGLHGVIAFSPNQPSTGSTSLGWTILLATGYMMKIPFFIWTYSLGGAFTVASAFTAALLSQRYFGDLKRAFIVAVVCMLEWHLAWVGLSGMETSLFIFLTLLFFLLLDRDLSPAPLGALTGLIVLVRPEGILLVLVYGLKLLRSQPREIKHILLYASTFLLTFSIIISPWVIFNFIYSHRPFPNTISAKFMQYGYPWSLWKSLKYPWDVLTYFLDGSLMLILPGAGFTIYNALRTKSMHLFHPLIWFIILTGLYAVALPAIYDHGRYLMPLIPLVTIYGIEGTYQFLERLALGVLIRTAIWIILFGMVISSWINSSADYAFRIQILNTVHGQAAQWINTNAPQNAVIATHDIGIIGYYSERQIVDLAGLVTPEIVPIMNNPQKMADYVRAKQVTHLIVYSGYYRDLITQLNAHLVFSPSAEKLRALGIEPFEVYEISK
jgi:hypothetical protein